MNYQKLMTLIIVTLISLLAVPGLSAQVSEEKRPFDFSDKHYWENGIQPSFWSTAEQALTNFR